jgi:hypothetical protein
MSATITAVYYPGANATLSVTFADADNVPTDPDSLTLTIIDPSDHNTVLTDSDVTKDSTGVYHYLLPVDQAGEWFYQWAGTGTGAVVNQGSFVVRALES